MPDNKLLIFDETERNLMSSEAYTHSTARLSGLQSGIASSSLQNKFQHQTSYVVNAIGELMKNNGIDANDDMQVSQFITNLSSTLLQKNVDKADFFDVQQGTNSTKYMTPQLVKQSVYLARGDTLPISNGGTGGTNAQAAINNLVSPLSVISSPTVNHKIPASAGSQSTTGGITISKLFEVSGSSGLSASIETGSYTGNGQVATNIYFTKISPKFVIITGIVNGMFWSFSSCMCDVTFMGSAYDVVSYHGSFISLKNANGLSGSSAFMNTSGKQFKYIGFG